MWCSIPQSQNAQHKDKRLKYTKPQKNKKLMFAIVRLDASQLQAISQIFDWSVAIKP